MPELGVVELFSLEKIPLKYSGNIFFGGDFVFIFFFGGGGNKDVFDGCVY